MSSITVRIEDEITNRLEEVSKHFSLSKDCIIKEALLAHLQELEEDIEDYNDAIEVLNNSSGETISWEEVQRQCGLAD